MTGGAGLNRNTLIWHVSTLYYAMLFILIGDGEEEEVLLYLIGCASGHKHSLCLISGVLESSWGTGFLPWELGFDCVPLLVAC